MRNLFFVLLLSIVGCGIVDIKQDVETVLIQSSAYTIAVQISRSDPGIVPQAKAYCVAIIQSNNKNLAPLFETGLSFLRDRYKNDPVISGNVKYLAGMIATGENIDCDKIRIAAKAFLGGLSP